MWKVPDEKGLLGPSEPLGSRRVGLGQPGPGKGVEVPPCPGAAAGSGPGRPGLAHCLRPRQACLGRHMEAGQARGVERLRGGPRCAGTGWTLHAQGCGSFQPKVTAESAKEAADRTSLGGLGAASRVLSPRSQGEHAQRREGLSPRSPGPTGLSRRLLLGGLSAPEDMGLGVDPAELSGKFKSLVDTITSQALRHWPWPSSLASPCRVLAIGLGGVGVSAPAVLLRAGQPSGQHRCWGAWGQRMAPLASGSRRVNRLSEMLHYHLVSFLKSKDLLYTYVALHLPLRTP